MGRTPAAFILPVGKVGFQGFRVQGLGSRSIGSRGLKDLEVQGSGMWGLGFRGSEKFYTALTNPEGLSFQGLTALDYTRVRNSIRSIGFRAREGLAKP